MKGDSFNDVIANAYTQSPTPLRRRYRPVRGLVAVDRSQLLSIVDYCSKGGCRRGSVGSTIRPFSVEGDVEVIKDSREDVAASPVAQGDQSPPALSSTQD